MERCEYNERLSAYFDGELPEEERLVLEKHLAGCGSCARELEAMRGVSGLLKGWEGPHMLPMAMARLHQAIDRENLGRLRKVAISLSSMAASLALATMLWAYGGEQASAPAAWERIAVAPAAPRTEDIATGTTEEVATAQWVLADLAMGGRDE